MLPPAPLAGVDVATLWRAIETAAELCKLGVYLARVDCTPPTILYASARAAAITGRTVDQLIGQLPWAMLREDQWPAVQQAIARTAGAPPMGFDVMFVRPDGSEVPVELAATRIAGTAGEVYVFGLFADVSAERAALAALRASETRFRFLVEAAPDGVVILVRGAIVFINPRAAALLGTGTPEAALGQPIASLLPPEDARLTGERIAEMFRTGVEMPPNEYRTLHDPNRVVEIKSIRCDWEGQPAVLAFARDVTERREIQRRMVEADRLAALGTLAAGVAHEINNPLTYTQLSAQRIDGLLANPEIPATAAAAIRVQLREIDHGIARVASITQGLRLFARGDDAPPSAVDLTAVVEHALQMVDHDLRHHTRLVRRFEPVSPVRGNASQLEQVIVNLLLNASHARTPGADHAIEVKIAPRGTDLVALAIADNGHGIPEAIRGRIFDPFFTTRPIGEGMGLGLSVCKTIVEAIGGSIEVDSAAGRGTTMTVVLRVDRGSVAAQAGARRESGERPRARVLIVDDERFVRDALARLLSGIHDVSVAASGEAALALIAGDTFDAIICDVLMPGMDGRELSNRIAVAHPGLERRIVFMSGGTFTAELDAFLAGVGCLDKPFKLDDVLLAIETKRSL
ncbi:MAG TPA: PAS domain S-box protein [Kofleriaceae bacterium]|nr:PAS domain S-box protein [Kofleriaceae bacterium]